MNENTNMVNEYNGTDNPFVESSQNGFERFDDFEFDDNSATLQENTVYLGEISNCYGVKNGGGEMKIKLTITLEDGTDYDSQSLYKYSPLKYLVKEAERKLDRKVKPADLIGKRVEFTVKYNQGFWNLKTIKRI